MASAESLLADSEQAATQAYKALMAQLGAEPQLLLVHCTIEHDCPKLLARLRELAPGAAIHGGTSCRGIITKSGAQISETGALGLLGFADPDGSYGVGLAEASDDPGIGAQTALEQALDATDRPGEVPGVVLLAGSTGTEEQVIGAIEEHLGTSVPIIGGTTADHLWSGKWQQLGGSTVKTNGISIAVLFPSVEVGYSFHSGYEPSEHRGRITRADGRVIKEIDGRPAVRIYNEWTGGVLEGVATGSNIVELTNLAPLGYPVGQVGGIPYFRLSHPVEVLPDEAMLVYTAVQQGGEVILMRGTLDNLVARAGHVASAALAGAQFSREQVLGAMMIFCAGCMLTIGDRLPETVACLRESLGGAPFLTTFTFGEQGCFIGGENRHGNLMISVLVFGRR